MYASHLEIASQLDYIVQDYTDKIINSQQCVSIMTRVIGPKEASHRCVLHVGSNKTGSTAIQEFLSHQLADTGFRYFAMEEGEINGSKGLADLFLAYPELEVRNRRLGITRRALMEKRPAMAARFAAVLSETAGRGQTLLLSGETLWRKDAAFQEAVHSFLRERDFCVEVLGYVRPLKSWYESIFQQLLKINHPEFSQALRKTGFQLPASPTVREVVELLDAEYGRNRVSIRLFDRNRLEGGCVVRDYCRFVGIGKGGTVPVERNKTLTLPVIRCLYAYRRFGPLYNHEPGGNFRLINRLRKLPGASCLRFHSSVVSSVYRELETDLPWLDDRLGFSLREDITRDDDGPCIRSEADLFDFEQETLDWLARETGSRPVLRSSGVSAAREVAMQVHHLYGQGLTASGKPGQSLLRRWKWGGRL